MLLTSSQATALERDRVTVTTSTKRLVAVQNTFSTPHTNHEAQSVQVKAARSTVKMGIDYDNQYQVDIPLTVSCCAHTAVKGCTTLLQH